MTNVFFCAWFYIFGAGSPLNILGKLFIGLPIFPYAVCALCFLSLFKWMFFKKTNIVIY
jgi:hypothetical protein